MSLSFLCRAAQRIRTLSTNFQIGFGSFVDKVLGPYTSLNPDVQDNPCRDEPDDCEPTYSYRHVISLTSDVDRFEVRVYNAML